jgi:hypothetical protein
MRGRHIGRFVGRAVLALVLAIACQLGACKGDSPHLERARKLMASGQWANARTALGQALQENERDTTARGLLLYSLDHEDGLEAVAGLELYGLFQFAVMLESPGLNEVKEARALAERTVTDARSALFDKGLDTKDLADLRAVLRATARWGFEHDKDVARRDVAAAILAFDGDRAATSHLVERLKTQAPSRVVSYLADAGAVAVESLRKVLADEGFIGRSSAREALARILAEQRALALVSAQPELLDPSSSGSTLVGRDQLGASVLSPIRDPAVWRVHARYVGMDDDGGGVVLLQSWHPRKAALVVELYVLERGELRRLSPRTKAGASFELAGASVVHGLDYERGMLVLRRYREHVVDVEVETGPVSRPAPGMRVRLRGHAPHGTIVREDDGLWVVRVDQPIEEMTELPVAASTLIGLRSERRPERAVETIRAVVKDDILEVTSTSVEKEER